MGNGEQSFPTPAGSGDVTALGHLLALCRTANLQEEALSGSLSALESELEQYKGVRNIWVQSSKGMCFPSTCAATVLKKCKFGHL